MGASDIRNDVVRSASIQSAAAAFSYARECAAWEWGHGGYTGTIAEKPDFIMTQPLPDGVDVDTLIDVVMSQDPAPAWITEPVLNGLRAAFWSKWDAALCVPTATGWTFFGTASC